MNGCYAQSMYKCIAHLFSYPRHQLFGRPPQLGLQTLTRRVYVLLHGFFVIVRSTSR